MDITGAISGITAALGLVKELRDINAQFDQAELKLKIADITVSLADAKSSLVDADEQIRAKDDEIARLKEAFRRTEATVEKHGYRYRVGVDGQPKGLPFCTVCLEDGRFSLTVHSSKPGRPAVCPRCKSDFGFLVEYTNEE